MSGARPESDHRFTPHGSTLRRAQGPEPSRGAFHGSWERAENDTDGLRSFAAVERSTSDRLLSPGPVRFADVLYPAHGANFPPDIVRNRDNPQLCAMAIGSPTEFLHDLGQLQVIARD